MTVESAARAFASIYGFAVFLFALHVTWSTIVGHYTVPNFDDWRILDEFFSKPLFQWIVEDQGGHRVPITLGLLFVDYTLFGGHMLVLVLASLVCTGVGVAILAGTLRFGDESRDPLARSCVGFACFLLCWAAARFDLVWGIQHSTLMAAMWSLVCMASLGVVVHRRVEEETPGHLPLLAAAGAAIAATFSQGVGFSCWAGLITVGLIARLPARTLFAYGLSAAVVLSVYLSGIEIPVRDSPQLYAHLLWQVPGRILEYTLAFVGAPAVALIGMQSPVDARGFVVFAGAIGVAGYIALLLVFLIRRDRMTSLHVFAIGLPSTALVGGMMVALNRHFWPETAMNPRFTTWATLFWIGLVCAVPVSRTRTQSRHGWPTLAHTLLFVVLSTLLVTDLQVARNGHAARNSYLIYVSTMHVLGIRWDKMAGTTRIPMPDRAYRVVERLRRDGRSFFDEPRTAWLGTPVSENFTLAADDRCAGAVTWTERVRTRDGPAVLLTGWGLDRDSDGPLEQVLVADRDGIVRGLGVFVAQDANLGRARLPARHFPWAGFIGRPSAGAPYRTYGVLDRGTSVCELDAGDKSNG